MSRRLLMPDALDVADSENPAWPVGEASSHARAFFEAVASGDSRRIAKLVADHYAADSVKSVEEEIVHHRSIGERIGAFSISEIELPSPHELKAWGWAERPGVWMEFVFELEHAPPHRIRRANGRAASPPRYERTPLSADMPLGDMLAAVRAATGAPAVAVAVSRTGHELQTCTQGVRMHGATDAASADDLFHIGSISKPMSATAIAHLVEIGELEWTTTLGEVVRDLDLDRAYRPVSVADLLHHRGGIAPFTNDDEYPAQAIATATTDPSVKRREVAREALRREPVCAPGTETRYSNAGYVIAAVMAEQTTGRPWEALMQEHLFGPWLLASCGFGWPVTRMRSNQPHGHFGLPGRLQVQREGDLETVANLRGAGDVHCNVADLARFGAWHLQGLRAGTPTISPEMIAWLHAPPGGRDDGYAGGWEISHTDDMRHDFHGGSNGTFFAWLSIYPEIDTSIAAVTNCGLHARPMIEKLVTAVMRKWRL